MDAMSTGYDFGINNDTQLIQEVLLCATVTSLFILTIITVMAECDRIFENVSILDNHSSESMKIESQADEDEEEELIGPCTNLGLVP